MEYCISVYLEQFELGPEFRKSEPVQTVWGPAWREPFEEGRYYWTDNLYVRQEPVNSFLVSRLPSSLQRDDWQALEINGIGLEDFESCVNQVSDGDDKTAPTELNQHPFLRLLMTLLEGQPRWAVFFLYNCDDIAHDYRRPLQDLPQIVIDGYRWNSDETGGFSCSDGE